MSSKKDGNKVRVEVLSDYEEFLQLKGHLNDVYLFTDNTANIQTNISQRGKNEATKYFLIPRQFRRGFRFDNTTSCQRFDVKNKVIFMYVVDKMRVNPSRRELALKKIDEKYKFNKRSSINTN